MVNLSGGNSLAWNRPAPNTPQEVALMAIHELAMVPTLFLVQSAGNHSCTGSSADDCSEQLDACDLSYGDEDLYVADPLVYQAVSRILIAGGSDEADGRWTNRAGDPGLPGNLNQGSNGGACVDVFAPAAHVLSASHVTQNGYCHLSGTSMAAPHVAGVAALILQNSPYLTSDQLKQEILATAKLGALQGNPSLPGYIGPGSPNRLVQRDTNEAPVAILTVTCNGLHCIFDGTQSSDDWGFDAAMELEPGPMVRFPAGWTPYFEWTYAEGGTNEVTLRVSDEQGLTDSLHQTFVVSP